MSELIQTIRDNNGKGKNVMKNDTYQSRFETIQNPQDEDLYDSF